MFFLKQNPFFSVSHSTFLSLFLSLSFSRSHTHTHVQIPQDVLIREAQRVLKQIGSFSEMTHAPEM